MTTDASLDGWGAHCGSLQTQGLWSDEQLQWHINVLELMAVFLALKAFCPSLRGSVVRILTDNTACMYYIRKQGGTMSRRLSHLAQELWLWAIENDISLVAFHLAGLDNCLADRLSSVFIESHEWEVDAEALDPVFRAWGSPEVDLFATSHNRKCRLFASRFPEADSLGDALLIDWSFRLVYAFPPVPLIHRVLLKLRSCSTTMILLALFWARQTWISELQRLSIATPVPLPMSLTFMSRDGGAVLHHNPTHLKLTAWLLKS